MKTKLKIGYQHDFEVRKEVFLTSKNVECSVLYLSDLHLNAFGESLINKIEQCIADLNPTIVLLGGDYVDSRKGLFYFEKLLISLSKRENVFAIAGNHDYFFHFQSIKKLCEKHSIQWIENTSKSIFINKTPINIVGTKPNNTQNKTDFNILFLHQPIDIQGFASDFDIVFAGHLHGCQFVFWENENGLFPGKWFYKWNILKTKINDCLYLVSKGLGDTLPIRYNCKKDVIFVAIKKAKDE
jgi:uncharacterized protein